MKIILNIALVFLLSFFFACDDVANNGSNSEAGDPKDSLVQNPDGYGDSGKKIDAQDLKDCEISGKALDNNSFRMDDVAQMISISADESTQDADLGDSHRVLQIYNTTNCSSLLKTTLPVNRSPDFPYYLATNCYEKNNKIVGIKGYTNFYYYDAEAQKLSNSLEPGFLTEKEMVDAQSGMINSLTVWGNYIIGNAIDLGPFAFDVSDKANPKPVLPIAEFNIPNTEKYHSLFMLDAGNGTYQAILPNTTEDNAFEILELFPQALKVENSIAKNARNNRFILLKDFTEPNQEKRVAIDMLNQRNVPLPDDIAVKKTAEIISWLKAQQ